MLSEKQLATTVVSYSWTTILYIFYIVIVTSYLLTIVFYDKIYFWLREEPCLHYLQDMSVADGTFPCQQRWYFEGLDMFRHLLCHEDHHDLLVESSFGLRIRSSQKTNREQGSRAPTYDGNGKETAFSSMSILPPAFPVQPPSNMARHAFTSEQLSQYFTRICLPHSKRIYNISVLTDNDKPIFLNLLQKHHLCKLPWENLSMHYSWHRVVNFWPAYLFKKSCTPISTSTIP